MICVFLLSCILYKCLDKDLIKLKIDGKTYKVHKNTKPDAVIHFCEQLPDGEVMQYSVPQEMQQKIHEALIKYRLAHNIKE